MTVSEEEEEDTLNRLPPRPRAVNPRPLQMPRTVVVKKALDITLWCALKYLLHNIINNNTVLQHSAPL